MQKSPLFILFHPLAAISGSCVRDGAYFCTKSSLNQLLLKADAEEWQDYWSSAQITYRFDHRI